MDLNENMISRTAVIFSAVLIITQNQKIKTLSLIRRVLI